MMPTPHLSFPAERSEGKGTQVVQQSRYSNTWLPPRPRTGDDNLVLEFAP